MAKAAIFDMDGTLVDTERLYRQGWLYAAEAVGEVPHPDFPAAMSSVSGKAAEKNLHSFYPNQSHATMQKICKEKFLELVKTDLSLMPGVRELLTYLKENGYKIAMATSSGHDVIDYNINKCGIAEFFDALVSSKDVENGKPAPDIYLLAAEKVNVPIEDCYVFEDTNNGVLGAVASGAKTIMVVDLSQPDEFAKANCSKIYNSMNEVLEAMKNGSI